MTGHLRRAPATAVTAPRSISPQPYHPRYSLLCSVSTSAPPLPGVTAPNGTGPPISPQEATNRLDIRPAIAPSHRQCSVIRVSTRHDVTWSLAKRVRFDDIQVLQVRTSHFDSVGWLYDQALTSQNAGQDSMFVDGMRTSPEPPTKRVRHSSNSGDKLAASAAGARQSTRPEPSRCRCARARGRLGTQERALSLAATRANSWPRPFMYLCCTQDLKAASAGGDEVGDQASSLMVSK
jgi:hypothetical protein